MPEQFETLVGESGMKLSGGQRQRIAIARALLYNPEITSRRSDVKFGQRFGNTCPRSARRLMEGRTTLIIAHRLSTVIDADQLIFLENRKITGIGKHDEFFRTHEFYREFAQGQGLS